MQHSYSKKKKLKWNLNMWSKAYFSHASWATIAICFASASRTRDGPAVQPFKVGCDISFLAEFRITIYQENNFPITRIKLPLKWDMLFYSLICIGNYIFRTEMLESPNISAEGGINLFPLRVSWNSECP